MEKQKTTNNVNPLLVDLSGEKYPSLYIFYKALLYDPVSILIS